MRQANRRIGGIDALPARSRGAVNINLEVILLDFDIDFILNFRINKYRTKLSMAAFIGVERGNTNQCVYAHTG